MGGDRRDRGYPILTNGDQTAVPEIWFLSEKRKTRENKMLRLYKGNITQRQIQCPIYLGGAKECRNRSNAVCYITLKNLSEKGLQMLLRLYN